MMAGSLSSGSAAAGGWASGGAYLVVGTGRAGRWAGRGSVAAAWPDLRRGTLPLVPAARRRDRPGIRSMGPGPHAHVHPRRRQRGHRLDHWDGEAPDGAADSDKTKL